MNIPPARKKRSGVRVCVLSVLAIAAALLVVSLPATAGADTTTVTYVATQVIPVPPASDYHGSGGGDGWGIALTSTGVYQIFHHSGTFQVACHNQSDAQLCSNLFPERITDGNGSDFSSSSHPGMHIDPASGKLYAFATRNSDTTAGVVCVDTTIANTTANPFCGFTPLTGVREGGTTSAPAIVGTKMFAFDYVSGVPVGNGAQDKLLCFDLTTLAACAGQPFTLSVGAGTVNVGTFPVPAVAAIGNQIIVPITVGNTSELACFDGAAMGSCNGSWPVTSGVQGYPSGAGAPFPMLDDSGNITGLCIPTQAVPCFNLAGGSVATPSGLAAAIAAPNTGWNGPAVTIGPRMYLPNGNTDQVHCYDYSASAECTNPLDSSATPFPHALPGAGFMYTVNADPQRPDCIWINADNGVSQLQNFDAFTGGRCGEGPVRVFAERSVAPSALCTPGSWKSLVVTAPPRNGYTDGTVAFVDNAGRTIPGTSPLPIDQTGSVDLTGLDLSKGSSLPVFLITLNTGNNARPGEVHVQLTWTGVYDQSCLVQPGTTVPNPPAGQPKTVTPPSPPAKADVIDTISPPTVARTGTQITFTSTVTNNGPDATQGVIWRAPVPTGAKVLSLTSSLGTCAATDTATCYIGTLGNGQSATITLVVTTQATGPLTVNSTVEDDHDVNMANNSASSSVNVISPTAPPPAPPATSTPGTFNAIAQGTVIVNGVAVQEGQIFTLKSGDDVNVTDGTITFTGSDGQFITVSRLQFVTQARASQKLGSALVDDAPVGEFTLDEPASAGAMTTLTLAGGDFTGCASSKRTVTATKSSAPVRQLWTSGKGNFTTKARFASATVRGTVWLTQDRCDGTFVQVATDAVDVTDNTLNKTTTVSAGQTYLAPAQAPFKPPALTPRQTAAQVKKRGLIWGGKTYKTRVGFTAYLTQTGYTWTDFATPYPKLAAALTARSHAKKH
jgi:uncharacterized repeat protein (TIGR01451 family)